MFSTYYPWGHPKFIPFFHMPVSRLIGFYMNGHCNYAYTVYPKEYAHGFCFAVLCCGYTLTDFPISIRFTSLALWQSNDCPSSSKATLMNMDKYFMWIHYERLHNNNNKAKHNKTVCIFLGIYCIWVMTIKHTRCILSYEYTNWYSYILCVNTYSLCYGSQSVFWRHHIYKYSEFTHNVANSVTKFGCISVVNNVAIIYPSISWLHAIIILSLFIYINAYLNDMFVVCNYSPIYEGIHLYNNQNFSNAIQSLP